jgi:hypothetical protein
MEKNTLQHLSGFLLVVTWCPNTEEETLYMYHRKSAEVSYIRKNINLNLILNILKQFNCMNRRKKTQKSFVG